MTVDDSTGWVRYLYYMRFGLFLWLFPPLMAVLNAHGGRTLTSGILVPETWTQFLCVSFFIVSTGFVALVIARVVVINGRERFELTSPGQTVDEASLPATDDPLNPAAPPRSLRDMFDGQGTHYEGYAVALSMVPTLGTFAYLLWNGIDEGVGWSRILLGLLVGAALAAIFWYVVNVLYYLVYEVPPTHEHISTVQLGKTAARTVLFPRRFFKLPLPGEPLDNDTIESAEIPLKNGFINRVWRAFADAVIHRTGLPGYVYPGTSRLYEAPFFSLVAVSGFVFIYLVIWPLAAPVPTRFAWVAIAAVLIVGAAVVRIFLSAKKRSNGARPPRVLFSVVAVVFFTFAFPVLYVASDAERFPVFASLLVAVTMFLWLLAIVAFFLDRYRVPVFTLLLLVVVLPRLFHLDFGREEHYFSVIPASNPATVPTPAEILQKWIVKPGFDADEPVIVVTATGGGLHASAWTAAVLAQLEAKFHQETGESMYPHVLLMSTVSGGSTGVLSYLQASRSGEKDYDESISQAACSSLEAVGWGLIYHDMPVALFEPLAWIFGSSSGIGDLDTSVLAGKDRTWALRKGFERNLKDAYCDYVWSPGRSPVVLTDIVRDRAIAQQMRANLTLRTLTVDPGTTPALTMNTTTAETGERFLLANYGIPRYPFGPNEAQPAESFLQIFGDRKISTCDCDPLYPDLPLATAAQLSATFPYVSSAARFPGDKDKQSAHFIDGGYYDNDGTASVLEFLRYALDDPEKPDATKIDPGNHLALQTVQNAFTAKGKHLRIVLIEIRNSDDDPADTHADETQWHTAASPGNLLFQLTAPLSGFWHAGHTSVTARNRAALDLIEEAYADRLQVHHIIIADKQSEVTVGTDPLNWSLTPRQRKEVSCSAKASDVQKKYTEAADWMNNRALDWTSQLGAAHPSRTGTATH